MKIASLTFLILIALSGLLNAQILEESFESETFPPTGWRIENVLGSAVWQRSTLRAKSGIASAFMEYQMSNGEDWLISPKINLSGNYRLSFWLLRQFPTPYPPDNLQVRVSVTDSSIGSFVEVLTDINTSVISHRNWTKFEVPLGNYEGQEIFIAFRHTNTDGNGIWLDSVSVQLTPPNDAGVSSSNIFNGMQLNKTGTNVTAYVKNFGSDTINNVNVYYTLDGGSPVGPVITAGDILPGDSAIVTFSGGFAISSPTDKIYDIKIFSTFASDSNEYNDTLTARIYLQTPVSEFPFLNTFQNSSGYVNSGAAIWSLSTGVNPNGSANDTMLRANFYNTSAGNIGFMRSVIFDFSQLSNPVISFWVSYRSYLTTENDRLQIAVSTNGGLTFDFGMHDYYNKSYLSSPSLATLPKKSSSWVPNGTAREWRHETVDLSEYSGFDEVIIAFVGTSDFGNNCYIDNMSVFDAPGFASFNVSGPGTYGTFTTEKVQVEFISLEAMRNSVNSVQRRFISSEGFELSDLKYQPNEPLKKSNISGKRRSEIYPEMIYDGPTGGELVIFKSDTTPLNTQFDSNFTATSPNGSIFTPQDISGIYWHITYSGDDYYSTSTYDLKIPITGLNVYYNKDELYIVKRSDQTGKWRAINTQRNGDTLVASSLQGFSEFAIGYIETPAILLNVTMIPEALYNTVTGKLNLRDTVTAYLANGLPPYNFVDTAIGVLDSITHTTEFIFFNAPDTNYFIVIDHRNTLQTWSRVADNFTNGRSYSFDFTASDTSAYGSALINVSGLWAIPSGDVNKDGVINTIDRSILWNLRNSVSRHPGDLNGDGIIDATDRAFTYNNRNFTIQKP
ncbi:hypothetical protein FBQ84_04365 [Ignavibacteria bacterium CHB1]|nr:MAG: hypothetical protein EDM69_05585 [Chlorobiota bacterium]MBV6398474.1 hypothetical protein [Ignavibacteria bacterium]MCC6885708.1 choice-of-anchor J domain-containing protein [Ignavibacteriales bacterium]MCE7953097.1 hypothetical protein [Chlorobi bacterium CHB7]MDL1887065.1 hypothetical protein [Ignavibacteria bacterium CHB1]RIK49911.1 MAG: hypothetical protein DCC60_02535 [Ignavibacteriota bacterium]